MAVGPMIEITDCRLCGWGLRAGWMAQELLTTFAEELGSVALTPDGTGGVFEVRVNNEVIWSRKEQGRFPELKEIKQFIRDRVARSLPRAYGRPMTTLRDCRQNRILLAAWRRKRAAADCTAAQARLASEMGSTAMAKRTKAAIAEQQKFSALLKMLRAGLC